MADEKDPQNAPQDPQNTGNEPAGEPNANLDEGLTDKHGQPAISADKYEREKAAWEAKEAENKKAIEELQQQLGQFKATEDAKAEFEKQLEDLKAAQKEREVEFQLELAGCKATKAAKAVLGDYEGDVLKLKEAMPFLFGESKQSGTTGLPPAGATDTELERKNVARKAAGLPPIKE